MINTKFPAGFGLSFIYFFLYCIAFFGMRQFNIIDDAWFIFNILLSGLYQWLYLIPFIIHHHKQNDKIYEGYLVGGITISGLNLALWLWIVVDPSFFF